MYDAIVVGARCAGSPTAMLLARRGHRVLLVDRASFPSDTYSTHFIQLPGMARLRKWGLLDALMATGCPPITTGILSIDGQRAEAEFPMPAGVPGLASPRRTVLDKLLVDAARAAGAEVREGLMVDRLVTQGGRVVGIEGHGNDGTFEARARIVIGADGRNSPVARLAGAAIVEQAPVLGAGYYSYWSGVECPAAELYLHDEQFAVAFPTHDGLTTIATGVRPEVYADKRKDPEAHATELLDRLGSLGERTRAGRRVHDLIGIGNLSNFLRRAWGPGWALVGDALYHKDPTPADGISDAFRGADLLARSVHAMLSDDASEEEALTRYEEEFGAFARPFLAKTLQMSSFDVDPMTRATAFMELSGMHAEEADKVLADKEGVPA